MDVLDFINSRDVRDYLESIDYKFGLLEEAYIIFHSYFRTMSDKKAALTNLINTKNDYLLGSNGEQRWSNPLIKGQSTHDLIKKYLADLDVFIKSYNSTSEGSYYEVILLQNVSGSNNYMDLRSEVGIIFSTVDDAISYAITEVDDSAGSNCNYNGFEIRKKHVYRTDFRNDYTCARFNKKGNLMEIEAPTDFYSINDIDLINDFFEKMWFDIPIPFKKGDIVVSSIYNWGLSSEPFVLMNTYPWIKKNILRRKGDISEGCDSSDMNASGYSTGFYRDDPLFINDDVMCDYLDLEYYRGEYAGTQRLLLLMARQITNEIDIWEYTYSYRQIVAEYQKSKAEEEMNRYLLDTSLVYDLLKGNPSHGNNMV